MLIWFVAGQVAILVVVLISCAAVEMIRPVDRHIANTFRFNLAYAACMAIWALILQPVSNLAAGGLQRWLGDAPIRLPDHGWPVLFSAFVLMIASDGIFYWCHRAQHASSWLWAMHSFHHSDDDLNVGTAYRHYWLERPLWLVVSVIPLGLAFRVSPEVAVVYGAVFQFFALFPHLNSRIELGGLSKAFLGPQLHRVHHSADPADFNSNFAGAFPMWDLLFGTYRAPTRGEFPPTGLRERPARPRPTEVLLWPIVRKIFRGGVGDPGEQSM